METPASVQRTFDLTGRVAVVTDNQGASFAVLER